MSRLCVKLSRFTPGFYTFWSKAVMANEFYSPGEQRAAKVNELFAKIAPRYDLINDVQSFGLHRVWKNRLVKLAETKPNEHALDLCCGTGDLAFSLAKKGARVTGLDFNQEMLQVAAAKSRSVRTASEIEFIRGDAQQIPFPENTFDLLTIGYGLRNLSDLDAGLRDMLRVTRPGGRLLALEFGKPDNAAWRTVYFGYLKTFLPLCGLIFCGRPSAYAYILESLKHYPDQRGVSTRMARTGWQNVRVTNLLGGVMSIHRAEKAGTSH